jgi:hypothetical protein
VEIPSTAGGADELTNTAQDDITAPYIEQVRSRPYSIEARLVLVTLGNARPIHSILPSKGKGGA